MVEPLPIGYVELQASWVGDWNEDTSLNVFGDLMRKARSEHPGMVIHGSRCEQTVDGAGVIHNTYYLGLRPGIATTPPLNPRNLNDAQSPQIGNAVEDFSIGMKERRF